MTHLLHPLAGLVLPLLMASGWSQISCGDCDGSGDVTIVDSLIAAHHAVGVALISSPEFEACDIHPAPGDGVVTVTDSLRIAQYVVGLPVPLDCTVPTGILLEGFDDTSSRDDLLTDADWGVAVPGAVSAPILPAIAESFPVAGTPSSVPFRDAGSRTQLLLRPADLQFQGGRLQALQLFLGDREEAGRRYTDLEVLACPTSLGSLGSVFQANYDGHQPTQIKPPGTETYGEGDVGSLLDLRITPSSFNYSGVDNLLIEIIHHGASAQTVVQADSRVTHDARVHSSGPTDASGFPATLAYRVRAIFDGGFQPTSEAVSLFYDTGSVWPIYRPASAEVTAPTGTSIVLFLEGAPDDGGGQPYLPAASGWLPAEQALPLGLQYVRFKIVVAATALETPLVHRVRIPYDP